MHYFHKSLKAGKAGEIKFAKLAAENDWQLTATDGKSGDFLTTQGEKVEVKSDTYDHDATGNFFIEWWSDLDKLKPGGPLQAQLHGCKFFVYYFSKNNIAYVFDVDQLCKQLQSIDLGRPIYIQNIKWRTSGYKVPRHLLTHIRVLKAKE